MKHDLLFTSIGKHVVLDDNDRLKLTEAFHLRKVKKGQFLVHEGGMNKNLIFIIEGSVVTYFIDLNGHEHIIQFGVEGWWIGDFQSYIFQKPATCNVEALEDCEVLECAYETAQRLYDEVPRFERYHRIATQFGYAAFQQRVLQNLSMNAEDRYVAFHKRYGKLELRFPQKIIASYLGMTPEFYSKLKKKIAAQDKLRFQ
jgi:CRP-like cAMP-binding protein